MPRNTAEENAWPPRFLDTIGLPVLVSDLPASFHLAIAFVLGALWGSFFNVAIHRWPRDMSVVSPPSHCPACGKPIPAWRNVPIVSYLLQRGKAACCGARMSPRYLVVELLSGVLAVALAQRFVVETEPGTELAAASIHAALWFVFTGALVIATFVDLEWWEIPDEVSIGGTAIGLATVTLRGGASAEEVALGAGAGWLVVQVFFVWGVERLFGKRGMGEGDPKLAMMIGAFLGWRGVLFAFVAAAFQSVIAYAVARATGRELRPSASEGAPVAAAETDDAPPETAPAPDEEGDAPSPAPDDESRKTDAKDAKTNAKDAKPKAKDAKNDEGEEDDEDEELPAGNYLPLGPFLALGALEFLFFGDVLVDWYLRQFD